MHSDRVTSERSLPCCTTPGAIGAAALAFVVVGIILCVSWARGSCPKWTRRVRPGLLHTRWTGWRKLTVKLGSWRIFSRTLQTRSNVPCTGAELGLFATSQNTGDIAARLVPRNRRSRDIFAVMTMCGARSTLRTALHIEFVQILSDVINDLAGAAKRSRSSCSASG